MDTHFNASTHAEKPRWILIGKATRALLLVLGLVLGFPGQGRALPATTAEAIVAAIGFEPIMLTEVLAYRNVFATRDSIAVVTARLIDERLLAHEARRYGMEKNASQPDATSPLALWQDKETQRFLRDARLARQFLQFRFGEFVPVTREAIARYLREHPEIRGATQSERERTARQNLLPVVRAQREREFKEELRVRADVRFMVDDY
ncbi:MAG: hypothetical protein VKN33_10810 [Candidatus Sericytochromatia bacterium]|nr:hypothetical protein [Candidatus Sericytochromatia bacterium]